MIKARSLEGENKIMDECMELDFTKTLDCARNNHLSIVYLNIAETVDRFFYYKDNEKIFERLCSVVYDIYCSQNYGENFTLLEIARNVVAYSKAHRHPERMPRKEILNKMRKER